MLVWKGVVQGPRNTPYSGYEFDIEIMLPPLYPKQNPTGRFLTKIYHPNVHWDSGDICLSILNRTKSPEFEDGWIPSYTLITVQYGILYLLSKPNPKDAYNQDAANLYINNYEEFVVRAREFCKAYARKISTYF